MKTLKYILALLFVCFIYQAFCHTSFDEENGCTVCHSHYPMRCRISQASKTFFKDVGIDTFASLGSNMIGDQFHGKKINALSHKLAHAVLGGAMGYVLEGKDGVTPAAISSVLSETLMEELTPKQALGQSDEEYLKVVERTSAMVRMITASTALLLRQDIALMDRIGTNAIENNFMRHLDDVVELDEDDPIFQMDKEEALKELQARHEMLGRDGGDIAYTPIKKIY